MNPGKTHTYIWEIQQNQGPTDGDSPCLTHSYSSNTDSVKDINSGLIGALLVCRPGKDSTGWGQVTCNHELKSRKIKDTFQRLNMAMESVSCGQQHHFWGLALSSKSPFPVQEPNTLSLLERNQLLLSFARFQTTDEIFYLVSEPYLSIR